MITLKFKKNSVRIYLIGRTLKDNGVEERLELSRQATRTGEASYKSEDETKILELGSALEDIGCTCTIE